MKKLGLNPYLPFWETVPDGEPHVFGDRVYVYGSHDTRGGEQFCTEDYVCWSAPIDDLGNWKYEGVIFRKDQDPINGAPYAKEMPEHPVVPGMIHNLYAPDVCQGPDGRFYLYYSLDFSDVISVAVCDTPAGAYEFLDYVRYEDGRLPEVGRLFDPGVLSDETGNYLYYGFCPVVRYPGMDPDRLMEGSYLVKLADDMHTVISAPKCVANGPETAKGTGYEEHPFFEASSIRRIGEWYYFVYSSIQGNELCYGMAKTPEGPFEYKGVIVSNGDLGYKGNTHPVNYTGNNHGGLEVINGQPYIFWHRQTHGTSFSRQGCADKVTILEDGTIPQIEITSCGLNDGPLPAKHRYETYIACHLTEKNMTQVTNVMMGGPGQPLPPIPESWPYITEEICEGGEQGLKPYIYNMREGTVTGFKYFVFDGDERRIKAELRGNGTVNVILDSPKGRKVGELTVNNDAWINVVADAAFDAGIHALYFVTDSGCVDFASFEIL